MLDNLLPKVVYQGNSKFNKDIKVIKVGKTTKLMVDGIVQSFNDDSGFAKRKVWGQVVKIIAKEKPDAQRILLLGMGGGTMVHMLNKGFSNLDITSVEIDQKIVDLAYKYFGMDQVDNNRVIVADAPTVISNPLKYQLQKDFDCIVVDTCVGGEHPVETSSGEFLRNLCELAGNSGLLVFNRIIPKGGLNEVKEFRRALKPYVHKVNVKIIKYPKIADNYVFYGYTTKI